MAQNCAINQQIALSSATKKIMSKRNVSSLFPPRMRLCLLANYCLIFKPRYAWNDIVPVLNIYSMHRQRRVTQEPEHPQGQGEPRRRGNQTFSRVTLGQTEKEAAIGIRLGGCSSRVLSSATAPGTQCKLATQAHSLLRHRHVLEAFRQQLRCRRVSDPGLAKALASTLTARKSFLLLFFIIQMTENGLVVQPQSGSEKVEPSTPGVGRCNTRCNRLEAHPP